MSLRWTSYVVPTSPATWKFGRNFQKRQFPIVFARSASAVTPSEKSSINTNKKSTTWFSMSLWTVYVGPKPPKGAQKCKVLKIWTISCDNLKQYNNKYLITWRNITVLMYKYIFLFYHQFILKIKSQILLIRITVWKSVKLVRCMGYH